MPRLCHISDRSQFHLLVLVVVLMVTAGCAEGPTPTPTPPGPPLSAVEVLEQTRQAMTAVTSYKFVADRTFYEDGQVYPSQFSAQWAEPDRYRLRLEGVTRDGDNYWGEIIAVGDRSVNRNSDYLETWTENEPPPAAGFRDPGWAVAGLEQAELHDDTNIAGRLMYHVTASRPVINPVIVPVIFNSHDLYIGKDDLLVWHLIMESVDTDPNEDTTIWNTTYDFYDYNVPVTIELPEINE